MRVAVVGATGMVGEVMLQVLANAIFQLQTNSMLLLKDR